MTMNNMNKMYDGEYVCEINVVPNFRFICDEDSDLMRESIVYAVKRFFRMKTKFNSDCIKESFRYRVARGKERRKGKFSYIVPAFFMELPGNYVKLTGWIDAYGVNIETIQILHDHPCFAA